MDFLVLNQIEGKMEAAAHDTRRSTSSTPDHLEAMRMHTGGMSGSERDYTTQPPPPDVHHLSPTSARTIRFGVQKLNALYGAIQSADVVGAVRVLAASDEQEINQCERQRRRGATVDGSAPASGDGGSWWSRKRQGLLAMVGLADAQEDERTSGAQYMSTSIAQDKPTTRQRRPRNRRVTFLDEVEVEQMRKCWNVDLDKQKEIEEQKQEEIHDTTRESTSWNNDSTAEELEAESRSQLQFKETPMNTSSSANAIAERQKEAAMSEFLDHIANFSTLVETHPDWWMPRDEWLALQLQSQLVRFGGSRGRTRVGTTSSIFDMVPGANSLVQAARTYLPAGTPFLPSSRQQRLLEKLGEIKKELVEVMDEWCQSALDDPLQVPDDAFVKRKTAPPPAPPPPPPPPAPYVAAISSTVPPSLATEETIVDSRSKTTMNRTDSTDSVNGHSSLTTTSIQDALRAKFDDTGALILRKTAQARSPGGTPMRQCSLSQRGELQHELFSKLRSRYNSMNHEDDNDEDCCDEDDGRDFDDGPSTTSSAPATPSKSATIGVKKMSKWVDSVKIAGRFRRSNKQQQQQQHQHVTSAMDLFADRAATMQ